MKINDTSTTLGSLNYVTSSSGTHQHCAACQADYNANATKQQFCSRALGDGSRCMQPLTYVRATTLFVRLVKKRTWRNLWKSEVEDTPIGTFRYGDGKSHELGTCNIKGTAAITLWDRCNPHLVLVNPINHEVVFIRCVDSTRRTELAEAAMAFAVEAIKKLNQPPEEE